MKLIKEIIPYLIVIVLVVLIRVFIITPVRVDGASMNPTLINNEVILLKKYDKKIKRFDIIVLKYEDDKLVKRVIGLPGDHIKYVDNQLFVNDKLVKEDFLTMETNDFDLELLGYETIPEGYYFVMGDNRTNSTDSRVIGLISKDQIIGKTSFAIFPFNRFGKVE